MKPTHIAILLAPAVLFVACENPADATTDAKVSEAVAKTETSSSGTKYVFTPESEIKFIGSKVTGSHNGGFKAFTGHFTIADGAPAGNDHKVVIDMSSTWSDDEKLTGHLKSADFFDVEKHPESVFDVTSIEKGDSGYEISGNFTLHGVTKNITVPATVSKDGETIQITSKFDINRKDFGIVYPGKPDDLIRDEVVIELDLTAKPEA
ncbi:MAG: YceI family protein [Akkermansiaceae bacterium]|nr:YceI family protein [Akkermansiaceae bacterium]MCP5547141.1 YceI family protein [Akkermansiaceae bacterium]